MAALPRDAGGFTVKVYLTVRQIVRLLRIVGRRILLSVRSRQRVCTHEQHRFYYAGCAGVSRRRRYGRFPPRFAVRNAGVAGLAHPPV